MREDASGCEGERYPPGAMTKRTIRWALVAGAALVTAACSSGKGDAAKTEKEEKQERAEARREMREEAKAVDVATLILTNANVVTLDPKTPSAQAIAIAGDRILAVGSSAEMAALRKTRSTETIDLAGATVIPGLVDAHAHIASLGETLETVRLYDTTSWEQVIARTKERAATTPKDGWIVGDGWDQNDWAGAKGFPVHDALSAAVPDHPAFLQRVDGHAAIANAKALAVAGITKDTKDPPGGKIVRGKDGAATGVLVDEAMQLVARHIPAPTHAQRKERILKAQAEILKSGLTGVHDAGVDGAGLAAFEELEREGKLQMRVYAMLDGADAELLEKRFAAKPVVGDRLTVRSVKLYADGALGSRGAALLAPYSDDEDNRGLLIMDAAKIERITRDALAAGFQVNVHAIGDRGNREALDAFERALAATPAAKDARLRVEHAQVIAPEDIPRFAKLGVIASMQPTHATSDMPWAEARLGKERVKGAYAWRSLKKAGARLAFGSDFPVEGVSPIWGLHAAVTRQDRKNAPAGGWQPQERLDAREALEGFTTGAAYAAFEEATRGTIEAGKFADLVVLSGDPLTVKPAELHTLRVRKTIVGGKVVFTE